MITTFRNILLGIATIAFLGAPVDAGAARRHVDTAAADARKADYVFMEAMRQHALENEDAYYDLLGRAYELDTTNSEVGFY